MFPPDFCPAHIATVSHRARGRESTAGRQACGERGDGCQAKGPGFQRRQFFLRVDAHRPSEGLRLRLTGRCATAAPQGRRPLSLPPARPIDSRGFTAGNPGLSRLVGQTSGPKDKLQRGGELQRSSPHSFWINAPEVLPRVQGTDEGVPSLGRLETGLSIRCSRRLTGAVQQIPSLGSEEG